MARLKTRLWGLLIAGSCMVHSPLALADVRTDARREFRAGMQAVSEGRYDEGIAHLEAAYDILPHPNVLYNIALALMYSGRSEEAILYLERYKESAPASEMADVDAMIASLRPSAQEPLSDEAEKPPDSSGSLADTYEAAALEVRRLAEQTQSETLLAQARDLEKRAKELRDGAVSASEPVPEEPAAKPPGSKVAKPSAAVANQNVRGGLYEEEVVSASRFAQSPLDAPNATAIITAQDIRMTGMYLVTELLRRVSGVEVNSFAPTHAEVSIRGLNRRVANKVLFLVDGRPYRLDLLGTSWYNQAAHIVETLERIEVIRGPASALYGADAFSGIINFVTRKPGVGRSFVKGAYGSDGFARGVGSFTGARDKLSYRYSVSYSQENNSTRLAGKNRSDVRPLDEQPNQARQFATLASELRYQVREDSEFVLGGDATYGYSTTAGLSRLPEIRTFDAAEFHTWSSITTPVGFRVGAWWTRTKGNAGPSYVTPGAIDRIGYNTLQDVGDVDVSWSGSVGGAVPQTITVGGGYRYKRFSWDWLDGPHDQHHLGAYVQDVITLAKPLTLQVGARVDRHPLLNNVQFSPRGSLVYRLLGDQSLRLSAGRAFRGPSALESYILVPVGTPLRGVSAYGIGNDQLDPESIISYELGYQNQTSDYFALEANVYYNQVKDLILFTNINEFTLADFANNQRLAAFDEAEQAFPVSSLSFLNQGSEYRQYGGEAGVRVYPVQGLDAYANYSFHKTTPANKSQVDPVLAEEQQTSMHKFNLGLQYRAPFGLDTSVDMFWYGSQVWVEQVVDLDRGVRFQRFSVPSLAVVNARVGYRLWSDRLELGLVGTNLAFQDKRQHPFGQPLDTRVFGTVTLQL